jgi:hypothetical protein
MPRRKRRGSPRSDAPPPAEVVLAVNGHSHPAVARRDTRTEGVFAARLEVERTGELVLTEKGLRQLTGGDRCHGDGEKPSWDGRPRVLLWRGEVVKQLGRAGSNRERVLNAFEEEGWPDAVSDPLEWDQFDDLKARLRETVRGLNKGLKPGTIRFRGLLPVFLSRGNESPLSFRT